jgi:hypothetical protein
VIPYRLDGAIAARRACATAAVGVVTSLTPLALAAVLLNKLAWRPGPAFWAVGGALLALLAVRAFIAYAGARRRLGGLLITVSDDVIRVQVARDACAIERGRVARILEVEGTLGGLRVESKPDLSSGVISVVHVPRGGEAFGDVRERLEQWRPVERRGRRGPTARLVLGGVVVAGIFFVPFLLDDFVARSKLLAAALVGGMWLAVRTVVRRG